MPYRKVSINSTEATAFVIVEGQQFIAVTLENGTGVWGSKVLPLQTGVRKFRFHCLNELIDEVKVGLTAYTFVSPAEVLRVIQ
jgi:hypothetical protein